MELLKQSPKLEDLLLDINIRTWYDEEYVEGYEPFKPPESMPICVLSHLKTISITKFMGHDDREKGCVINILRCINNNSLYMYTILYIKRTLVVNQNNFFLLYYHLSIK